MRLCGVLAALGFITASTIAANAQMAPMKPKVTKFYMCSGLHFKAVYDNRPKYDRVSFVWGAKDYHLAHVASADGARYKGPSLEWWAKGGNATLYTVPEHTVLAECVPGKRF